jgi:hypothetical protein
VIGAAVASAWHNNRSTARRVSGRGLANQDSAGQVSADRERRASAASAQAAAVSVPVADSGDNVGNIGKGECT